MSFSPAALIQGESHTEVCCPWHEGVFRSRDAPSHCLWWPVCNVMLGLSDMSHCHMSPRVTWGPPCAPPRLPGTRCPPPPGTTRSLPRRQTRSQGPSINCKSNTRNLCEKMVSATDNETLFTCFVVCSPGNRGGTNSLKHIRHCFSICWYCLLTCSSWGPGSGAWSRCRASCWPGCAAPPGRAPGCKAPAPASQGQSPRPPWPFCRICKVHCIEMHCGCLYP